MKLFFLLISLLTFNLVALKPIQAQTNVRGLTVTPPRFELLANPGESLNETIKIRNDADTPVEYQVVREDFTSSGEEGGVAIEDESNDTAYSLASWITTPEEKFTLQPQEEKTVRFGISVPQNAEPGGHYASILFTVNPTEITPGAANVAPRVGSLILLRISGNVAEKAKIETFEAPKYLQNGPVPFTLRVLNEGNVHVQPKGTIIITDLLGRKVDEVPLRNANVLPGAVRKTLTNWEKGNLLGRYTATLVATYGQQNLPLTSAVNFTVASPAALVVIAIVIVALILFLISLFSGRSRLRKALKTLATGK